MLFQNRFLTGIRDGTVMLAFRRWRRPTVREGGTLLTPVGMLHIGSVKQVVPDSISVEDAQQAGYESREELLAELLRREDGEFYRIELGPLYPDPWIALRDSPPTEEEIQELRKKLRRFDSAAAWTFRVLDILSSNPGVRAGDLCSLVNQEKDQFKCNIRKLKNLGLTESLGTGYRLSPRGIALLERLSLEDDSNCY